MAALYLDVFVAIAQAFAKVPALTVLAPTPLELPFVIAQIIALALFAAITIAAARRFHVASAAQAPPEL